MTLPGLTLPSRWGIYMTRPVSAKSTALLTAAIAMLVGAVAVTPAVALDLPPEVARLLPGQATAVVVVSSLDELERLEQRMVALDRGEEAKGPDPEALSSVLASLAPDLLPVTDRARPVVIMFNLGNPLAGEPIATTLALPLQEKARDPYFLRQLVGDSKVAIRGDYAAVSSDSTYVPGDQALSPLTTGLPDGSMALRLDLAQLISAARPLIEMALASTAQSYSVASADSTAPASAPMSPEQVRIMTAFLRDLLDAAQRLDVAVTLAEGHDRLSGTLAVSPGSLLDLGPQPDFGPAVALSRHLSPDLSIVHASAMDLTAYFDHVAPYQTVLLADASAGLDDDHAAAYVQWLSDGTTLLQTWAVPLACGLDFRPDSLRAELLAVMPDPEGALESLVAHYARLSALDLGLDITEGPTEDIDGVRVRTFAQTVDQARLAALPANPTRRFEARSPRALLTLHGVYSSVRVATLPGMLVACADRDPEAMRALLTRVREDAEASGRNSRRPPPATGPTR